MALTAGFACGMSQGSQGSRLCFQLSETALAAPDSEASDEEAAEAEAVARGAAELGWVSLAASDGAVLLRAIPMPSPSAGSLALWAGAGEEEVLAVRVAQEARQARLTGGCDDGGGSTQREGGQEGEGESVLMLPDTTTARHGKKPKLRTVALRRQVCV